MTCLFLGCIVCLIGWLLACLTGRLTFTTPSIKVMYGLDIANRAVHAAKS